MAAKAPAWEPPPDPDLTALANTGYTNWKLDRPQVIAFDTETTGLEYHDMAFGASIAWPHDDLLTGRKEVRGHWFDFEHAVDAHGIVADIIANATVLVAHNAKFDLHKLEAQGITLRPDQILHDTEAMAHLDDEHRPKGLKELAVSVLGFSDLMDVPGKAKNPETGKMEDVVRRVPRSKYEVDKARMWAKKHHGLNSVKEVGYHLLPRGILVPYAVLDAEWTFNLATILHPKVMYYPEVAALYAREIDLTRGAIYEMEKAGMATRPDYVAAMVKEYRSRCLSHEGDIEQIVGKPVRTGDIPKAERDQFFNPNSSAPDARDLLKAAGFDRESYDADSLATINHPLARKLIEYRKDVKILDTYFVALQKDTGPDGVFHQSSRQHGTVSGRTSGGRERGDQ